MGRKNTVSNYSMFGTAGVDVSVASTTSNVTEILNMDNASIVVTWAGTSPVGTLTVQVSNDQLTWNTLDFGNTIDISGNSGSHFLSLNQLPPGYIRAVYTKVSGVGTLNSSLTLKQVGG